MHLVAGQHDGVIPASNIRYHHAAMSSAGMDVSYREFEYGHMDFTFSAKVRGDCCGIKVAVSRQAYL